MEHVKIDTEYIKLDSLLKLADMAQTGGHAKILIQEGQVKLNGVVEYQRGKKIKPGDIVEIEDIKIQVVK